MTDGSKASKGTFIRLLRNPTSLTHTFARQAKLHVTPIRNQDESPPVSLLPHTRTPFDETNFLYSEKTSGRRVCRGEVLLRETRRRRGGETKLVGGNNFGVHLALHPPSSRFSFCSALTGTVSLGVLTPILNWHTHIKKKTMKKIINGMYEYTEMHFKNRDS